MTGNKINHIFAKEYEWADTLAFRGEKGANVYRKKVAKRAKHRERNAAKRAIQKEINNI